MANSEVLVKESHFHDGWADSINYDEVLVNESFEACTSPENRYILKRLGSISGKKILEIGCGAGEASVYLAKKGALVTATDSSNGMLAVVQRVAQKHNVSLKTVQCYSTKTPFEDNEFDVVYAANLLHHVDVFETIKEVKRVLKVGGEFVCWEPLAHNPVINCYRRIASEVRTSDEHPLRVKEVREIEKNFDYSSTKYTWFFTLYFFLNYYFIDNIDPNKERYWKKIIVDHSNVKSLYNKLEKIDEILLKRMPFFKRYCWNVVFYCKNPRISP